MTNLMNKIEREIEKEAFKTGRMGSETVTVEIRLSNEEKKEFCGTNHRFDSENYYFEFEGNTLIISYTEEI